MKKSRFDIKSVRGFNFFVDWAIKKKHVALVEPNSVARLQSIAVVKFGSVKELLDSIKQSSVTFPSTVIINCFVESGAPYLLLHHFIESGFNVFVVDGKEVNKFRGERKKSDKRDAEYIRELYYQNPDLFKELSEPEKQDVKVRFLMAKYNHFTKDLVRFKNRQKAYERQFGETEAYDHIITELKNRKKEALKNVVPFIKDELEQIDIKGIGKTLVAQLLSVAHPERFPTLSRYLAYCGYTANRFYKDPQKGYVKGNLKHQYPNLAHVTGFQMAKSCIMHKNPKWYPFYLKVKEDLRGRFPDDSKAKINGKAINRLSTFLLKEIYHTLAEESKITV